MAEKNTLIIYKSWATMIASYPPEQAGVLIQAIFAYAFEGKDVEIEDPLLRGAYTMIQDKIAEDTVAYFAKVERAEAARRARETKNQNLKAESQNLNDENKNLKTESQNLNGDFHSDINGVSVSVSDTVSVSVTDKDKSNTPAARTQKDYVAESDLSEPLKEKILEWLVYKKERKESYKPTGLKSLLTEVHRHETESGADAVISLVNECMANGWRGIIWDRLDKAQPRAKPGQVARTFEQRAYDFSALEKQLVKNI